MFGDGKQRGWMDDPRVWGLVSLVCLVLAFTLSAWVRAQGPIGSGGAGGWVWRPPHSRYIGPDASPYGTPLHGDVRHWLCGHAGEVPCDKPLLGCQFHDANYPSHTGVDFPTGIDVPVETTMAGQVIWAGKAGEWGNLVVVENADTQVYFAHLDIISSTVGSLVARGDLIGATGTTGNSTGPHLHYGVLQFDDPANPFGTWIDPATTFSRFDVYPVPCSR